MMPKGFQVYLGAHDGGAFGGGDNLEAAVEEHLSEEGGQRYDHQQRSI